MTEGGDTRITFAEPPKTEISQSTAAAGDFLKTEANNFTRDESASGGARTRMSSIFSMLQGLDEKYSDVIHKWEWGLFDILVIIPGTIFGIWGVPFLVLWYFYYYQSPLFLVAVVVTTLINEGLKHVFKRPRPDPKEIGKKIIDLRKIHNNPSMPSGDTAQASVMAVTLIFHGYSSLWWLVVPVGAFGRVYFGSHFIGDCVIGALLGAICTYFVNYYMYVPDV